MTRAVVVTGAGGVGKTTVSAALGVAAGRAGRRTLVLTVDPARRLADALGIGEATVKTHLGRVYEKTGAQRQADLVRLVAGFASPLAN